MKRLAQSFMSVVAAAVLFLGLASISHAYTWITYNGHEYAVTDNWESWVAAEAESVLAGGHLATINNAAENEWVAETFKDYYIENNYGFNWAAAVNIGYYFDLTNNQWGWISGETSTYTNLVPWWNDYDSPHAYLHTNIHPFPSTWNHAAWHTEPGASHGYLKGIIERTIGVPEPATMLLLGIGLVGLAGIRRKLKS